MKKMLKKALWFTVVLCPTMFLAVACPSEKTGPKVSDLNFTSCKQDENVLDKVDVEFTDKGVQITYYNFAVTCDFTTVNVTYTFVDGVLDITQQGSPNKENCVCYTDVSYTIEGISQDETGEIFINGVKVCCNNIEIPITNLDYQNYDCMVDYVNMQADTVYVINSAEEFAQYFNCETDPQIDFATKTLLVAYGVVSGDVGSTNCELLKNYNNYILNVDVIMCITGNATPTNWNIAVIIDKDNIHNIMLNVNIIR